MNDRDMTTTRGSILSEKEESVRGVDEPATLVAAREGGRAPHRARDHHTAPASTPNPLAPSTAEADKATG